MMPFTKGTKTIGAELVKEQGTKKVCFLVFYVCASIGIFSPIKIKVHTIFSHSFARRRTLCAMRQEAYKKGTELKERFQKKSAFLALNYRNNIET